MPASLVQPQLIDWLSTDNGFNLHITIFSMLLLGGFGFPIPEDIPLILAGVAAQKGLVMTQAVLLNCYIGVIAADQIVYAMGYFFGQKLLQAGTKSHLFPGITEQRVEQIREGLRKKRLTYIFIGRHLFPVRTATFLTAGALRIPFLEFFLADAIAALVSVSVVVAIGYVLGGQLTPDVISHLVHESHFYILVITILLGVFFGGKFFLRRRRAQKTRRETSLSSGATSNAPSPEIPPAAAE